MTTLLEAQHILWPKILDRSKTKVRAITEGLANSVCYYRKDTNPENVAHENCCFVGALITPATYYIDLEGKGANHENVMNAVLKSHTEISLSERDYHFLADWLCTIQGVHDEEEPTAWAAGLSRLAPAAQCAATV